MTSTLQRRAPLIAMVVALVLVAMMVTRTSQAAFTATTENTGNSFNAGTVVLTDNAVTALFTLTDLAPGDSQTACIEVTYAGTIASPSGVVLYSAGFTDVPGGVAGSSGLSTYLNLTVEEGDLGATCAAFSSGTAAIVSSTLAAFDTASVDYTTGAGTWVPGAGDLTRAYRFTAELDAATPNEEQGASTTGVGFTWEVQS